MGWRALFAAWSPYGRTVCYKAADATGSIAILSVPATGGEPRVLVRFDDPSRISLRPEFATDGRRFYFTVPERQSDVWVMDLSYE